jgi:hypothetical protein
MADFETIREGLREIDIAVHNSWNLGKNMVVGWATQDKGIQLCIAPCFRVLGQATTNPRLLAGRRLMDADAFAESCKVLQVRPIRVSLPFKVGLQKANGEVDPETIDTVIRRYSISRIEHRAVMMLEIVDFSKAAPIEQIAQLSSLEYSINNAAKKMRDAGMDVDLGRSTAGDGIHYIWNRFQGLDADIRAYAVLLLILTDNALARSHAGGGANIVPTLRACFTVGPHYSYHQVESNKPRSIEYATGEVTITLARLINKAKVGQILVGVFQRPNDLTPDKLDTILFLVRAESLLQRLAGTVVGEHEIKGMRSIVTSGAIDGVNHPVVKYVIKDKHGYFHEAFNVRAKVKREGADVLELGLHPDSLPGFDAVPAVYQMPV